MVIDVQCECLHCRGAADTMHRLPLPRRAHFLRARLVSRLLTCALLVAMWVCHGAAQPHHVEEEPRRHNGGDDVLPAEAVRRLIGGDLGAPSEDPWSPGHGPGVVRSPRMLSLSAAATTITVGPAGADYTSLRAALGDPAVGSGSPVRIVVSHGTYVGADGNCGLVVNASSGVFIEAAPGAAVTVDCGYASRFVTFQVYDAPTPVGTSGLRGLSILRGVARGDSGSASGGGVLVTSSVASLPPAVPVANVLLQDLHLRQCSANESTTSYTLPDGGGAVAILNVQGVQLVNVSMVDSTSRYNGGCLLVGHSIGVSVTGGVLQGCSALQKGGGAWVVGAVGSLGDSIVITDSTFDQCSTSHSSACVTTARPSSAWCAYTHVWRSSSCVCVCVVGRYGGGLSMWDSTGATMANVTFSHCTSRRGVWWSMVPSLSALLHSCQLVAVSQVAVLCSGLSRIVRSAISP